MLILPTPETHGETGSVQPKQSQKATLKCQFFCFTCWSTAFWDRFGWTDPVSPWVSGVGNSGEIWCLVLSISNFGIPMDWWRGRSLNYVAKRNQQEEKHTTPINSNIETNTFSYYTSSRKSLNTLVALIKNQLLLNHTKEGCWSTLAVLTCWLGSSFIPVRLHPGFLVSIHICLHDSN